MPLSSQGPVWLESVSAQQSLVTRLAEAAERADLFSASRLLESVSAQQSLVTRLAEAAERADLFSASRLLESVSAQQSLVTRLAEAAERADLFSASRLLESVSAQQSLVTRLAEAAERADLFSASRLLESVSAQLARIVEPWGSAFASVSAWEASLTARMATLQTPWALQDRLGQSMIGFAHLSRLSDAVHTEEPYSEPVGELVADELGDGIEAEQDDSPTSRDTAAIEAGLNPDLIAFPPSAHSEVVIAAGFNVRFTPSPIPQAIESAESCCCVRSDPRAGD